MAVEIKILQAGPVTWEVQYDNLTSVTSTDTGKPIICFDNFSQSIFFVSPDHQEFTQAYANVLIDGTTYCVINNSNVPVTCDIYNGGFPIQTIILPPGQSDSFIENSISTVFWTGVSWCVHHDTTAERINIQGNVEQISVKELRSGDLVLNFANQAVQLTKVVSWKVPQNSWIALDKGSLNFNQPNQRLLIRPGHPVLIDGNCQILPEAVAGAQQIEEVGTLVTLCTAQSDWIRLNGAGVASWGEREFTLASLDLHLNVNYQ